VGDCNQLVIKTGARQLAGALTPSGTKLDRIGVPKREARDIGKKDMFQIRVVCYDLFFPFQGQILNTGGYWWLHHQGENQVMGYWMWGCPIMGLPPLTNLNRVSFE